MVKQEYSLFNPLVVSPNVTANSDGEYSSDFKAGMNKNFFNGSSVSTSVGTNNNWGNNIDGTNIIF